MGQIDIYILVFLIFSLAVGVIRGLSGEVGALLKFALTSIISYKILGIVNEKLGTSLIQNIFFPISIIAVVYILTSFILKIFIIQIVFILRTVIPVFIDKPLGAIVGVTKSFLILTMIYTLIATIFYSLKQPNPEWLKDSRTEYHLNNLTIKIFNITNITYDEDNIGNNSLLAKIFDLSNFNKEDTPLLEGLKPINNKKQEHNNSKLEKLNNIMDHYKTLKNIQQDENDIDEESDTESYDLDTLLEELDK